MWVWGLDRLRGVVVMKMGNAFACGSDGDENMKD